MLPRATLAVLVALPIAAVGVGLLLTARSSSTPAKRGTTDSRASEPTAEEGPTATLRGDDRHRPPDAPVAGEPPAPAAATGRPSAIEGRIVRADGSGALAFAEARLSFESEESPPEEEFYLTVRTDREGRFQGSATLRRRVFLTDVDYGKQPYIRRSFEGVPWNPGETLRLEEEALETARFAGVVVDARGEPLPDVRIDGSFLRPMAGDDSEEPESRPTVTRPDGRFVLGTVVLRPDLWGSGSAHPVPNELSFRKAAFRPARVDVAAVLPSERTLLRIVLEDGIAIGGRLVDEEGRALAGVEVEILPEDATLRSTPVTDAEGEFQATLGEEGKVRLGAVLPRRILEAETTVEVRRPGEHVLLVARRADGGLPPKVAWIIGLRLRALTEAEGEARGLTAGGVLIEGVGPNSGRLGIPWLASGCVIVSVDGSPVGDVPSLVDRLLEAQEAAPEGGSVAPMVSVRWTVGGASGLAGKYLLIDRSDVAALRDAKARLR